jgi:hypothetical protein
MRVVTHPSYTSQRRSALDKVIGGTTQLLNLLRRERVGPSIRTMLVLLRPPYRRSRDLLGKLFVWVHLVEQDWVLTRRLQPIREDASVEGGSCSLSLLER